MADDSNIQNPAVGNEDRDEVDSIISDHVAADVPMAGQDYEQAVRNYQAQVANQLRARKFRNPTAASPSAEPEFTVSPTPAISNADDVSKILQPTEHVNDPDPQEFAAIKKKYLKRLKSGKLTTEEEIAFLRAESSENARQRKLLLDAAEDVYSPAEESDKDSEDKLFLADNPNLSDFCSDEEEASKKRKKEGKKAARDAANDGSEIEQPKKRAKKTATKKSRKISGQDYTDFELESVLNQGKKSKKGAEKTSKAKTKPRPKKKAAKGPSMMNSATIMGTDVFRDAAANADLPDQPTFEGGRRADAMKQLIASVPIESRDTARVDQKALDEALKEFNGQGSVIATDNGWRVKGMKSALKNYQVLGSAFMRKRENGSDQPRGGILADAMGLGKTLMTLANIVNGQQPKVRGKLRTTLIVASPALVNQWFQEIQAHCERKSENRLHGLGTVMQYRAGHRLNSTNDREMLDKADIILTTYGEVNRSYPKADMPKDLVTLTQKDEWWKAHYEENKGVLHQLKFLRVVLDEAQQIKNHRSVSSMACRALSARHYWAITGTPILNTVAEFYSLFKFLREPWAGTYKMFRENFCDRSDPDCFERLNVFLRKFMVRRTHEDKLFGARLLNLPNPHELTVNLEFSEIERNVYDIVKNRMINRINCISKQGGKEGLQKKFSHIWTMILRLRQLCGHVLLIQGTIMDILEREDFEKLNRIADSEHEMSEEGTAILTHLKHVLSERAGATVVDGTEGATILQKHVTATGTLNIDGGDEDTGGVHGHTFRFKKYLRSLAKSDRWAEIVDRSICVVCRQTPTNAYISSCYHIFCFQCLTDMQHQAARRGHDSARCPECGDHYTDAEPCQDLEELAEGSTLSSPTDTETSKKKKKESTEDDWIDLPGEVLPSAKSRAMKMQIMTWLDKDPDAKILVYSQFMNMIRILEKVCRGEQWEYCKYTGQMSQDSRDSSVNEFKTNKAKKIMLCSLKAGGLGLNLTMASRVLLIDPWWNTATEQQAFARVYRIGQEKETQLTRLIVTNTIDEAMMAVKARKDEDIAAVMNDNKRGAMDVKDLMRLFGEVGEDSEGKPFIFPHGGDFDTEESEHLRLPAIDADDEDAFMGNEE